MADETKVKVKPDFKCTSETEVEACYDATVPPINSNEHAGDVGCHTYSGTISLDTSDIVSLS